MKVCGVELKANDANLCLLNLTDELFDIPDCRARRLSLKDANCQNDIRDFQGQFKKLMSDYQIDKVVIRQRPMKGKFAGGAVGFKLEAAIQLIEGLQVEILAPTDIKALLKQYPIPVPFADTGLKIFQETAFNTAYAYLSKTPDWVLLRGLSARL